MTLARYHQWLSNHNSDYHHGHHQPTVAYFRHPPLTISFTNHHSDAYLYHLQSSITPLAVVLQPHQPPLSTTKIRTNHHLCIRCNFSSHRSLNVLKLHIHKYLFYQRFRSTNLFLRSQFSHRICFLLVNLIINITKQRDIRDIFKIYNKIRDYSDNSKNI